MAEKIRVLYIHPAGPFGGASKSLLDALGLISADQLLPFLICPAGVTARMASGKSIPVISSLGLTQLDNTSFGGYQGLRKILILRELFYLPLSIYALISARLRWKNIDIVHINEITLVLLVPIIKILFKCPVVIHVRSTQNQNWNGHKGKIVSSLLGLCHTVIAIDETVKRTLPPNLPVTVVHNGFTGSFAEPSYPDTASTKPLKLAYIGGLMAAKGIFDMIEAAKLCRDRGVEAKWFIFGQNVRTVSGVRKKILQLLGFQSDVAQSIKTLIHRYDLDNHIFLSGHVNDMKKIYGSIDVVLCITHANAAGRPVFEGGFFGKPSIVAINNPLPDTVIPNETALCIPARNPDALADAVQILNNDRDLLHRLGVGAHSLANKYFNISHTSGKLLSIYGNILKFRK